MSGADRLFDSPAPMPGQLGLEHEDADTAESFAVEHVAFDIGRREVHGTLTGYAAGGAKAVIDTPEGEYSLPVSEIRGLTR